MSEILAYPHHIGGQEINEGDVLERRNPADNDKVAARYHDGSPKLMETAIAAAQDAFPNWSEKTTYTQRSEVIFHAARLLSTPEWTEAFVQAMVDEIGKTEAGARGEVAKTIAILKYMYGLGTHTTEDVIHADQPGVHMYTAAEPVGVAGLVTPFNFPLAVPVWKLAPALIAGNTVVMKPSPAAPGTTALLVKLFRDAVECVPALKAVGIGPGVINMVHGGPDVVKALAEDVRVQALSFTGSTEAGTAVLRWAINRPRPLDPRNFVAEMGGQNALVAAEDADVDEAASATVLGFAGGEGQRCTATSRAVVARIIGDPFMAALLAKTGTLKVGPGKDPTSNVGPLVSPEAADKFIEAVEASVAAGMRLIAGGRRLTDGTLARGNFVEPTILKGDPDDPKHLALRQEIFGPVLGVCVYDGDDQAIRIVNDTVGHRHVASIYTDSAARFHDFARRAKVGMVHGRNPTMGGDAQAEFGGLGPETSYGNREMGKRAMKPFQRDKTVDLRFGRAILPPGVR